MESHGMHTHTYKHAQQSPVHSNKRVIIALYLIKNGNKFERYIFFVHWYCFVAVIGVVAIGFSFVHRIYRDNVCHFALSVYVITLDRFCSIRSVSTMGISLVLHRFDFEKRQTKTKTFVYLCYSLATLVQLFV